jgi:hypothetical protein
MNEVTQLLSALGQGDPHAASRLLPLVYGELRKLAAQRMARERPGQTLQPTGRRPGYRCDEYDRRKPCPCEVKTAGVRPGLVARPDLRPDVIIPS